MENELNALDEVQGEVPAIPADEPAPDAADAAPEEEKVIDEAPDPATLKAEIKDLQEKKEAAKEAATKWRKEKAAARADYFKTRQEPAPVQPEAVEPSRPDPDNFDDYNDYVEKLTDWKVDQKTKQWDRDQAAKTDDVAYQEKMVRLQGKIDEGFTKYDDFEEVALAETVPITPMIQDVLAETENPADVAYYLGKNRTECIAISKLTPIAAARAIARIETKLEGGNPAPNPKKTTNAPPPIKPVGSSNTVNKDPEKMTQAEYETWRASQGARHH